MKKMQYVSCLVLACLALAVQAGPVQEAIQAAAGSGIVELPAGEYLGPIVLPDGFTLVGAGAGQTILDGAGASAVVVMGNQSALIGCTVRNGQIGIRSQKGFIGVFECEVTGIVREGIRVHEGSACLVNNVIACGPVATGVACYNSNPYVNRNVIQNNKIGVLVQSPMAPALQDNVFQSNATAVVVQPGSSVELTGNIFDGNGTAITGQDLGAGNELRAARPEELQPDRGHSSAGCRDMMKLVGAEAITAHPLVQYNLPSEPGRFYVAILYPWASFSVMASTPDTVIESYDAYDALTDQDLQAKFIVQGAYSGVAVVNPEIQESHLDRYVLEKTFVHAPSYCAGPDDTLVFDRLTNLPRIEVLLPPGYEAGAANPGAVVDTFNGRQRVLLANFGATRIQIAIKKTGAAAP